jgi:predicted AAA+ superfamily ATPase
MKALPTDIHHRNHYLDRIKPFIGTTLIKALIGQRRVGKSYILLQLMAHIKESDPNATIIYINKEDLDFAHITDYSELNEYIQKNRSTVIKTYVFIDEIQDINEFEKALRSLVLDDKLDLYCTGSNANLLSGELATFLSGRCIEITIHSLSFNEFSTFHALTVNQESLDKYLKFGGLPYLIHLPNNEAVIFEYLKNIYTTIIYRDLIQRYSIRNTRFLEQLVLFLADNTGSLFSSKKISDFLKSQRITSSPTQVQILTEYLTNTFIIAKVGRYDIKGKQLFEIGEKYYFENLGLRHAIWGYRIEDKAKIIENAVYNHLIFLGYSVHVGVIHPYEIDFVCQKNAEICYIQVALSLNDQKTIDREFGNLLKIKDNYPKMVITMEGSSGNTIQGIQHLSLLEFLQIEKL